MGGLHRFMSWPNAILTDSGGFQVFSLSGLRKITEEGVVFQSHLNGDSHTFTPESTVDVQLAFGSDILMVLDECPEYPVSHEYARESMQRTVRWARQADGHYRAADRRRAPRGTLCFPSCRAPCSPTCGANAPRALVELDARRIRHRRPFGGRAARAQPGDGGGHARHAAAPRPRYAMGVGMPGELPEYVARGVDMMDCVLPSRNARNGYLFTSAGPGDHQARAL